MATVRYRGFVLGAIDFTRAARPDRIEDLVAPQASVARKMHSVLADSIPRGLAAQRQLVPLCEPLSVLKTCAVAGNSRAIAHGSCILFTAVSETSCRHAQTAIVSASQ